MILSLHPYVLKVNAHCIKMIGAVWKLIIFTSMVKTLVNTSRNERVTLQVYDTCLQIAISSDCKVKTVSLVPRFLLTHAAVLTLFPLQRHPVV